MVIVHAMPNCFMLLLQLMRAAASRTFCTAGKSRPTRIAIIAMTTSSSINVNALRPREKTLDMTALLQVEWKNWNQGLVNTNPTGNKVCGGPSLAKTNRAETKARGGRQNRNRVLHFSAAGNQNMGLLSL